MASGRILSVVATAAEGVDQLRPRLVEPALVAGWTVTVTLTPTAATWLDDIGEAAQLAAVTGFDVRSTARRPTQPRPHPDPHGVVVAPASMNSIAKLALGIADNQALSHVGEAVGSTTVGVVLMPQLAATHLRHPALPAHLDTLQRAGVIVVDDPRWRPVAEPRQGDRAPAWDDALRAITTATGPEASGGRQRVV